LTRRLGESRLPDLALAILIGLALSRLVTSLVNDVLLPPLGAAVGDTRVADLYLNLSDESYDSLAEAQAVGAPTLNYGRFIARGLEFLVALGIVVWVWRWVERRQPEPVASAFPEPSAPPTEPEAPAQPATKQCPFCLSTIPRQATRCAYCTSTLERLRP
jgi:large conductance mechanosensitive channel